MGTAAPHSGELVKKTAATSAPGVADVFPKDAPLATSM
jgi:hypothetical protein